MQDRWNKPGQSTPSLIPPAIMYFSFTEKKNLFIILEEENAALYLPHPNVYFNIFFAKKQTMKTFCDSIFKINLNWDNLI